MENKFRSIQVIKEIERKINFKDVYGVISSRLLISFKSLSLSSNPKSNIRGTFCDMINRTDSSYLIPVIPQKPNITTSTNITNSNAISGPSLATELCRKSTRYCSNTTSLAEHAELRKHIEEEILGILTEHIADKYDYKIVPIGSRQYDLLDLGHWESDFNLFIKIPSNRKIATLFDYK